MQGIARSEPALELAKAAGTEPVGAAGGLPSYAAAPGGEKILVVEDEAVVALDLERSLRSLGYRSAGIAGSLGEAIELTATRRPDLVLLDIRLEGEDDGLAAAAEIRRRWQIPVVFLTAYSSDETLLRARNLGAHGYLIKPFRTDELHAAILMALNQQRLARHLFDQHTWLRTLLDSLSDCVIATDGAQCLRYLNGAAAELSGWTADEALGRPLTEVLPLLPLLGGNGRFLLRTRSGREVPVECADSPILEHGLHVGTATVFREISERLATEQQQARQRDSLREQVASATLALGDTRAELQALSRHLITAQDDERRHVARELHDDLGQQTALLELELIRLQQLLGETPAAVTDTLTSLFTRTREIAAGLRSISHRLHPSALEDLGLPRALRMLVDEHRRCGEDISLLELWERLPPLPPQVTTALYRIAQEALRNARRHAPQAPVQVTLALTSPPSSEPAELLLAIEDAGPGFDVQAVRGGGGLGLVSIKERARAISGSVEIESANDEGTRIAVRVPLPRS